MEEKHQKIKNKLYRKFLDTALIDTISEETLTLALNNIKGKHEREGRALVICMYYTGARPVEILSLKAKDLTKEGAYCVIKMPASKRGLPRTIHLQLKKPLVNELCKFALGVFTDMYLFYNYRSNTKKSYYKKSGDLVIASEVSNRLRYHFGKWFSGVMEIPPYYLRHNRFSKLAEAGASLEEIRILKGGRSVASVTPYLHMSSKTSKAMARKID